MLEDQRKLVLEVLAEAPDITIATLRPDGWPQATTVSFVSDGLIVYFGTWSESQKTKNIAHDNRVSLTANAPYKTWDQIRSISLAGRAEFVTDPAELGRVGELMVRRHAAELSKQTSIDLEHTRIIRVRPSIISILDYAKGFGHTSQLALA